MFNSITLVLEESIHVKFNDGLTTDMKLLYLEDDFANMKIGSSVAPKIKKKKQNSLRKFFLNMENHQVNMIKEHLGSS